MFRSALVRRIRLSSRSFILKSKAFSAASATPVGFIDSYGHPVKLLDDISIKLYNQSLSNFITHQNDPSKELKSIRQKYTDVGMVNALLVFQMIREPKLTTHNERPELEELLRDLERSFCEGELSDREEIFAAAAASFADGNYLKAAAMMESLFIGRESDIIALKLAQDSYILAGDTTNTLGCIARYLHLFEADNEQYGSVMGMLAMGLLECGNFSEAEEIASKAVNLTNGEDVWALHTLLNTYQCLGRSSEVGSVLNDHIGKHSESAVGLSLLLFNKGCGLVQRGNYTGALRQHDEMIYLMAQSIEKEGQTAGSITNATLLLWLVDVNSPSDLVDERWNYIESTAGMWTEGLSSERGRSLMSLSPMHELCRSIAIGAAERCATAAAPSSMLRQSMNDTDDDEDDVRSIKSTKKNLTESQLLSHLEGKVTHIESKAKVVWEWIRGITNPNYVKPVDEVVKSTPEEVAAKAANNVAKLEATALLHQNHLSVLRSFLQSGKVESQSLSDICPTLLAMKSKFKGMSRIPESPDPSRVSDRKWATDTVSEPLSEAMLAFSRHDYNEASDRLLEITRSPILNRLGGSVAQRDIVKQTLIESLMRCERMKEAEYLLTERTALAPNDAQSWRRLASLYGRTGERLEADRAHYTAWQLGIGQGGFGGPK